MLMSLHKDRSVCVCLSTGPGDYSPDIKSSPQFAIISSNEDRFKQPKDTTPGPGAYMVHTCTHHYIQSLSHTHTCMHEMPMKIIMFA